MALTEMTFFQRFEEDILAGKKTITIRDEAEKDFAIGSTVQVVTYEDNRWFCQLKIDAVTPIHFDELTELHAQQENMTLAQLQQVIKEIYPNTDTFYVINYSLVA